MVGLRDKVKNVAIRLQRKRPFLTVLNLESGEASCYRRLEFADGGLISSVKTSSVCALAIARSSRVSNSAKVSRSRRTSMAKVLCPSWATAVTHPTGPITPRVISPYSINSAMLGRHKGPPVGLFPSVLLLMIG